MAAFIGRSAELKKLNDVFNGNIRNCYIDAAPRSGATTLVRKFCEKHKFIYTRFPESTRSEALKAFRNPVESFAREPLDIENVDFDTLFLEAARIARDYDPVFVFDGCHNAPDDFPAALKTFSDSEDRMIILIGRGDFDRYDITFSDRIVLDELTYRESTMMHPKMSMVDCLRTYMAVGGSPLYHAILNKNSFSESVEKAFLGNAPKLCMECETILRESSVPYPMCCAILSDIAGCMGRPVDIAEKEGISRQLCDIYLKKLVDEGHICTLSPIGNSPKKPAYIVRNPLIAFYFIAIRMNPNTVFSEKAEYKDIESYVDMFMELRFRDICEDYLRRNYKCKSVGKWWQKEEDTNRPTLAAVVDIDGCEKTIVADCKFRKERLDTGALKAFVNRSELIEDVPDKILIMFSISGFEDKLIKRARTENITLIGPDSLL